MIAASTNCRWSLPFDGTPHRLWSLWEVQTICANLLLELQDMLVQFTFLGQDPAKARLLLANSSDFKERLQRLIDEVSMPEFDMCRKAAVRLLEHIESGVPRTQILHDAQDLRGRLLDQTDSVAFLALSLSEKAYFDPPSPLFGDEVEAKFTQVSEDISEAGKCLALSRPTAAVFHLMRVMERALQRLGAELGIALVSEKNWQNILDEVNKAIKALDHKQPRTRALAEAASEACPVVPANQLVDSGLGAGLAG